MSKREQDKGQRSSGMELWQLPLSAPPNAGIDGAGIPSDDVDLADFEGAAFTSIRGDVGQVTGVGAKEQEGGILLDVQVDRVPTVTAAKALVEQLGRQVVNEGRLHGFSVGDAYPAASGRPMPSLATGRPQPQARKGR